MFCCLYFQLRKRGKGRISSKINKILKPNYVVKIQVFVEKIKFDVQIWKKPPKFWGRYAPNNLENKHPNFPTYQWGSSTTLWLFTPLFHFIQNTEAEAEPAYNSIPSPDLLGPIAGLLWFCSTDAGPSRAGTRRGRTEPCSCPGPTSSPAGTLALPPAPRQPTEERSSYCQGWCIDDGNANARSWCLRKGEDHTVHHSLQLSPAQNDNCCELSLCYQRMKKLLEAPTFLAGDRERADAQRQQSQGSLLVIAALREL